MPTDENVEIGSGASKFVAARELKFDEMTPERQIQKLRYELMAALDEIHRLDCITGKFIYHIHNPCDGEVAVPITHIRRDGVNRRQFLE